MGKTYVFQVLKPGDVNLDEDGLTSFLLSSVSTGKGNDVCIMLVDQLAEDPDDPDLLGEIHRTFALDAERKVQVVPLMLNVQWQSSAFQGLINAGNPQSQ